MIVTLGITSTKDLQEGITSSSTNWSNQVKINLGWSTSIFSGFGVWLGVSAKIVTVRAWVRLHDEPTHCSSDVPIDGRRVAICFLLEDTVVMCYATRLQL